MSARNWLLALLALAVKFAIVVHVIAWTAKPLVCGVDLSMNDARCRKCREVKP